ncbi:MAG: GHMP kinase [Vicinamibacteria bacterium]|nr:GHMP kinase [Vicinamibacteria bacterium]
MNTTLSLTVTAPVRIADLGGWTDTWFAGHGAVCHLAVAPGIEVRLEAWPASDEPRLVVDAHDFGERHELPDAGVFKRRHALLAAAIGEASTAPDRAYHLHVRSGVPPGASTGSSAAVVVAVLAAFDAMAGEPLSPASLARRAHEVEVQSLGLESGVQDQIAAAYGGANFIEMPRYPETLVEPLLLGAATREALDQRLLLVYLGRGHDSSAVHRQVIASLVAGGGQRHALEGLRALAWQGRAALLAGDLAAYGRALSANCDQQAELHPSLVSDVASRVIGVARAHGATGWKVNGAGGDGGSLTVLCGVGPEARALLARQVEAEVPGVRALPVTLSATGVRVRIT